GPATRDAGRPQGARGAADIDARGGGWRATGAGANLCTPRCTPTNRARSRGSPRTYRLRSPRPTDERTRARVLPDEPAHRRPQRPPDAAADPARRARGARPNRRARAGDGDRRAPRGAGRAPRRGLAAARDHRSLLDP